MLEEEAHPGPSHQVVVVQGCVPKEAQEFGDSDLLEAKIIERLGCGKLHTFTWMYVVVFPCFAGPTLDLVYRLKTSIRLHEGVSSTIANVTIMEI